MKRNSLWSICFILVIVGALNWLLVGLSRFDVVAAVTGRRFGDVGPVNAVVYVIVGAAGVYLALASLLASRHGGERKSPTHFSPR